MNEVPGDEYISGAGRSMSKSDVAKTAMEILIRREHGLNALDALERSMSTPRSWTWMPRTLIWDDYLVGPDAGRNTNYYFGWALHQAKHPDAKEFHKWSQRRKTQYRQKFELCAIVNKASPRHALHRKVMELAKVQQVANALTK